MGRAKLSLEQEKQKFAIDSELEKKKVKENLVEEFHRKLQKEMASRENSLRENLRNEYELKLKKKIQEQEEALKKRKLDLELEIQKRMKEALS